MRTPAQAGDPSGWGGLGRRAALLGGAGVAAAAAVAVTTAARSGASGRPVATVEIADMTWIEVAEAIAAGYRTALVPSGGLEQNGPHLPIGKHDLIVRWAARQVALELGDALVAPVVSYVPEGEYDPPTGHMRYPGTIGVPEPVFAAVLDGIARSLKAAGFTLICFLADHGGSLSPQREAASRLSQEWARLDAGLGAGQGVRVLAVDAYYADAAETAWLRAQGEPDSAIGQHAAIADVAELLVARPEAVRLDRVPGDPAELARLGGSGDPRRATPERGRALMAMKIDAAVRQIRAAAAAGLTLRDG